MQKLIQGIHQFQQETFRKQGGLFILRNAGNLVPPHGVTSGGEGTSSSAATPTAGP